MELITDDIKRRKPVEIDFQNRGAWQKGRKNRCAPASRDKRRVPKLKKEMDDDLVFFKIVSSQFTFYVILTFVVNFCG